MIQCKEMKATSSWQLMSSSEPDSLAIANITLTVVYGMQYSQ